MVTRRRSRSLRFANARRAGSTMRPSADSPSVATGGPPILGPSGTLHPRTAHHRLELVVHVLVPVAGRGAPLLEVVHALVLAERRRDRVALLDAAHRPLQLEAAFAPVVVELDVEPPRLVGHV